MHLKRALDQLGITRRRDTRYIAFVIPSLLGICLLIILPWTATALLSLFKFAIISPPRWNSLSNYTRIFGDSYLMDATVHTLLFAIVSLLCSTFLGATLALTMFHLSMYSVTIIGLLLLPFVATPIAMGMVWRFIYNPDYGVLNYLISLLNIPPGKWTSGEQTVLLSLCMVDIWQWTPYVALIVLSGCMTIRRELYEVASVDGATRFQQALYLTLPLSLPFVMAAVTIRTLDALKTFDIIWSISEGGPGNSSETVSLYVFRTAFIYNDVGYASAIGVAFSVSIALIAYVLVIIRQKSVSMVADRL